MNWLVLLMESFATVFFLFALGIVTYVYLEDKNNSTAMNLSLAFLLLFFSSFGQLLYDTGMFAQTVKIVSTVLGVLAGVVFIYIFLKEELTYRTILKLRGAI